MTWVNYPLNGVGSNVINDTSRFSVRHTYDLSRHSVPLTDFYLHTYLFLHLVNTFVRYLSVKLKHTNFRVLITK